MQLQECNFMFIFKSFKVTLLARQIQQMLYNSSYLKSQIYIQHKLNDVYQQHENQLCTILNVESNGI